MRLVLLAALLFAYTGSAQAQHLPAALMVRADSMLAVQPRDPDLRLAPIDRELYVSERRSRMVLSVGIGIVVSAALHTISLVNNNHCRPARKASMFGAVAAGGVGLAFAIGGGASLAMQTRETRYAPSQGQKMAMGLSGLGAAVVTQAALVSARVMTALYCYD